MLGRLPAETGVTPRADFEAALKDWDSLRNQLAQETRRPEVILQILDAVQAPTRWSQLTPPVGDTEARFAFMNASLMRKRLTLGDLMIFMDWDRETLERYLERVCLIQEMRNGDVRARDIPSPVKAPRWFDPRGRDAGSWAFILNRLTGLGLTFYARLASGRIEQAGSGTASL